MFNNIWIKALVYFILFNYIKWTFIVFKNYFKNFYQNEEKYEHQFEKWCIIHNKLIIYIGVYMLIYNLLRLFEIM